MLRRNTKSLAVLLAAVGSMLAMPTAAYAADELGSYGIDTNAISVSGISSGGYMAQQFHVAHSKEIMGAGIIAGGPYDCADNKPGWPAVFTAMAVCSHTLGPYTPFMGPPNVETAVSATKTAAEKGSIDPTQGLAGDKVYLFSGTKDSIVPQSVMDQLKAYYGSFIASQNITYVNNIQSEHAMVTDDYGSSCDALGSPYINNCNYDTAGKLLNFIYGPLNPAGDPNTGKMIEFSQTEFLPAATNISMNEVGHLFVPPGCETSKGCRLHIALHGCDQYQGKIGDAYYQHAGYNKWAATNRIIVLYPQTAASTLNPQNPNGCWDWWGYTDDRPYGMSGGIEEPSASFEAKSAPRNFDTKSGKQITAVQRMIDRLAR